MKLYIYIYQYTMQPAKKNVLTTTQKNTHPVWGPPGVYPARNLRFLQVAVPMFWVFLAAALLGHRCGIEWNQLSKVPETNAKFITLGAHWICVFFCFCFWFLKLVYLNWRSWWKPCFGFMKFTTGCQHLLIDDNERWWFLSNHLDTFLNLCKYWLFWCEKRTTPLNNIGTQNDATFEAGDTSTIYQLYIHHQIVWKQLHTFYDIIRTCVYIHTNIYKLVLTFWSTAFSFQPTNQKQQRHRSEVENPWFMWPVRLCPSPSCCTFGPLVHQLTVGGPRLGCGRQRWSFFLDDNGDDSKIGSRLSMDAGGDCEVFSWM